MEEELHGREAGVEAVRDEALGVGLFGVGEEVGERSLNEPIRDSISGDHLLSHAVNHLADVNSGAFRSAGGHDEGIVRFGEVCHAHLADGVANIGEKTRTNAL